MTEHDALRIRMDSLERAVETLKRALVDQARMLHKTQQELQEAKHVVGPGNDL